MTDPAVASSLPASLQLMLTPIDITMIDGHDAVAHGRRWHVELKSGPGKMRVYMMNAPGWTIRAVRLGGTDITDAGLEFKPGEDIQRHRNRD